MLTFLLFIFTLSLSTSSVYAQSDADMSSESTKISDLTVLFERAKEGITDLQMTKTDPTFIKSQHGKTGKVERFETTQLLSSTTKNGDTTKNYSTTIFNTLSTRSSGGDKWDDSYGVKAYITIDWTSGTYQNIATASINNVSGGWLISDSWLSISNLSLTINQNGVTPTIPYPTNQSKSYSPGTTFNYSNVASINNWEPVLIGSSDIPSAVGTQQNCTVHDNSDSWSFPFNFKISQ